MPTAQGHVRWENAASGRARRAPAGFLTSAALLAGLACQVLPASALSQQPSGEAQAHLERGLELAHSGELASAEEELRRAARLAPDNPEFLASLATVLAMEKKLEESTLFFEKALKRSPGDIRSRTNL